MYDTDHQSNLHGSFSLNSPGYLKIVGFNLHYFVKEVSMHSDHSFPEKMIEYKSSGRQFKFLDDHEKTTVKFQLKELQFFAPIIFNISK